MPEQLQTSHPLGWGIAWYPNDHQAAIVSKDPAARGMDSLGRRAVGSATLRRSGLELFADTEEAFRAITRDVEAAKKSLLMEFYIWQEGGAADAGAGVTP